MVVGVGGVSVAVVAFIAGCAFASAGNLAWFAFLGLVGAASLHSSSAQLQRVRALLTPEGDDTEIPLPKAA
jgi:cell division protein FtsW (lipid II flippase)